MSVEGTRQRMHPSAYADKASVDYDEYVERPEGLGHAYVTCAIARGAVSVTLAIDLNADAATIVAEKALARAALVGILRELADKIEAFGHAIAPDAVQG